MENHEIIFEKIKELLYKVFPNEIIENQDEIIDLSKIENEVNEIKNWL